MRKGRRRRRKIKTIFSLLVILLLTFVNGFAALSGSSVNAAGQGQGGSGGQGETGGEKSIKVTITVTGLENNTETHIVLAKKAEEGAPPVTFEGDTVNHQVAFDVPPGGSCTIMAVDLPGYITPAPVTLDFKKLKGNFTKSAELAYEKKAIAVSGIRLDKNELSLLKGEQAKIVASVIPPNASHQNVTWASSDSKIATVDGSGMITAKAIGNATVTAKIVDGGNVFTADATISVREIKTFAAVAAMIGTTGQVLTLPQKVNATLNDDTTVDVAVQWEGANRVDGEQVIVYNAPGSYTVMGSVSGTNLKVELKITIAGEETLDVTSLALSHANLSVYIGKSEEISIVNYSPEKANVSALVWKSTNPQVATVTRDANDPTKGTVHGLSAGYTVISVSTVGGVVLGSIQVSVAVDPSVMDDVYIMATTNDSAASVDQFDSAEEVFIRGYGLPEGNYYIKVEDKGSGEPLGTGRYQVLKEQKQVKFNLFDKTNFKLSDSYSKSYFVYMSLDPSFPHGDNEDGTPKTVQDNFKIGSPVPTGSIVVKVDQLNGNQYEKVDPALVGADVILGREFDDKNSIDTTYHDYLNPLYNPLTNPNVAKYIDEVKLVGHINVNGGVDWDVPKEVLKLGGYVLEMELPQGYVSNLDFLDPTADDGSLIKDIHIERDQNVQRQIIVQRWGIVVPPGGGDSNPPNSDGDDQTGGGETNNPGDTGDGRTTPPVVDPPTPTPTDPTDGLPGTSTPVKQSAISVIPTVENNKATIKDSDIAPIAKRGKVELNVKGSKNLKELSIVLSKSQIDTLKTNEVLLTVAKGDVTVDIPTSVLVSDSGDVVIRLEKVDTISNALSPVYDLSIMQNDKVIVQYSSSVNVTYPVDVQKVTNPENVKVFSWNEENWSWELVGGLYEDGQITAAVNHSGKYTVFETSNVIKLVATTTTTSPTTVSTTGSNLPDTSTNEFNWLLGGGSLFVIGLGLLLFWRKRDNA